MNVKNIFSMEFKFKLWIAQDDELVLGKGGLRIIKELDKTGFIAETARNLDMSYKFTWEYVKRIDSKVGGAVTTKKGVKGGAEISDKLRELVKVYEEAEREIKALLQKYNEKLKEIEQGNF